MLYNKDWDKTKTDPLTLESLIAWLEKQSPDEEYCFIDTGACLLGRYAAYLDPAARFQFVSHSRLFTYRIDNIFRDLEPFGEVAQGYPRTFGAALNRAKAAL